MKFKDVLKYGKKYKECVLIKIQFHLEDTLFCLKENYICNIFFKKS